MSRDVSRLTLGMLMMEKVPLSPMAGDGGSFSALTALVVVASRSKQKSRWVSGGQFQV